MFINLHISKTHMNLIRRLKEIARKEGIPESELILDEARSFMEEHKGHGNYEIQQVYHNEILDAIHLECSAGMLLEESKCPHNNPDEFAEFGYSIIYSRRPVHEIELQRKRREKI